MTTATDEARVLSKLRTSTARRAAADAKAAAYAREQAELIRLALTCKVPYVDLMRVTGLSRPRIDQIRRRARI